MQIEQAKAKMEETLITFSNELLSVRTGRASVGVLDDVKVDYYGSLTPLNQIAGLSVVEGTQIVIKPYDATFLKEIEKAIHQNDLGLNPINDGTVVRVNIPVLTEEVRKEVAKDVSKMGENTKVIIRNIRRDANSAISSDDSNTEDDIFNNQKLVQDLTDTYIQKVDDLVDSKTKEVMTI